MSPKMDKMEARVQKAGKRGHFMVAKSKIVPGERFGIKRGSQLMGSNFSQASSLPRALPREQKLSLRSNKRRNTIHSNLKSRVVLG